jgi:adenosylcobinamide kinase/adenosylcobinamide-phosphate guanylyltransferase
MDGPITSMSKEVILITGGARSGKSWYAEQRALKMGGRRLYVATAEAKDEEMAQRIAAHRKRRGNQWRTVEEPLELTAALVAQGGKTDCALVDCLTLWISNLLIRQEEKHTLQKVDELIEKLPQLDFHLLLVTNEVGWGIIPDNPLARKFRDLAGWTNQRVAQAADEVILMVAGMPMIAKKGPACS